MIQLNKLAIIAPSRLGDTIFITPLLRFARKCYPCARIDVFTMSAQSASVLAGSPYIDGLHVVPMDHSIAKGDEFYLQYDIAFSIFEVSRTQNIAKALAKIAFISPPLPELTHRTHEILSYFCQMLKIDSSELDYQYELFPSNKDELVVQQLLSSLKNNTDFLVGLHIGCHQLAKNRSKLRLWWRNKSFIPPHKPAQKTWPISGYSKLVELCYNRYQGQVKFILTGTEHENQLAQPLAQHQTVINLIGRTHVLELAALMSKLNVYITGDTGSLHVACASYVHVLGLFGPTQELITGPYPNHHNHTIIRQGPCVTTIAPDKVMKELTKLFIKSARLQDSHSAAAF